MDTGSESADGAPCTETGGVVELPVSMGLAKLVFRIFEGFFTIDFDKGVVSSMFVVAATPSAIGSSNVRLSESVSVTMAVPSFDFDFLVLPLPSVAFLFLGAGFRATLPSELLFFWTRPLAQ